MPEDCFNSRPVSRSKFAYFKYKSRESRTSRCVLRE